MDRTGRLQKGQNKASPEEFLRDYAKSLNRHRKNRRAVLVRLSLLSRMFSKPHHRRAAAETFIPIRRQFEGELFNLSNGDIVCALYKARLADLDEAVLRIRVMFRDDHNLKFLEQTDRDDLFCQWFDLEQDYDEFYNFAQRRFRGQTDVYDRLTQEFAARENLPTDGQQKKQTGDKPRSGGTRNRRPEPICGS